MSRLSCWYSTSVSGPRCDSDMSVTLKSLGFRHLQQQFCWLINFLLLKICSLDGDGENSTFEKPLLLTNLSLKLSNFCPTGDLNGDCQKQREGLKRFDIVGEGCSVSFGFFLTLKMTALKCYSSTTSVVLCVKFSSQRVAD